MIEVSIVASELNQLKQQLNQTRLSHRDTTLKSRREILLLKRIILRFCAACKHHDSELDKEIVDLATRIEQVENTSDLTIQIATFERLINRYKMNVQKEHSVMEDHISYCGETLQRVVGLPAGLKRDLRSLLQYPSHDGSKHIQRIVRLVELYERAIKFISVGKLSSEINNNEVIDSDTQEQLSNELQHLISELDFNNTSGTKLLEIRSKLLTGTDAVSLIDLALQTLQLVLEGTNNERKASQVFVGEMNTQVAQIIKTSEQNQSQGQSYLEQRSLLNEEYSLLIKQAENLLDKKASEQEHKAKMAMLLNEMNDLAERNSAMQEREAALLERHEYTTKKLNNLYEETLEYRRQLSDQQQRVFRDPLTKVYNRAAMHERLDLEYKRWVRHQHSLVLTMIDIDQFKRINERFGHLAGDKALTIIAKTIENQVTDTDFVARFSGEEFLILFTETNKEEREKKLKAIQLAISKLPFKFKNDHVQVTVSVCSSEFTNSDIPEKVIKRTIDALYKQKSKGKEQFIYL
ncbi:GGDEF domain-containing protein [Aliivibrio finisterrensis]|uniref:diguanylate cyclase n=1 Tax=Aliivibrio finisterrensis TaxID=511998 RepID=A0A4Q5KIN2_9GAMM|nr:MULTISPECIES: GGDEF domain-containing protein [Aliivibrio]MDD9176910.1 GGDEF domain-containing protein [Aliivibrio sp. S3TY1]MDD9194009.1 GGDEF domain-containing protein [Aliivibrio sp. S2TY2]RYU44519.1 GGDEF domain-containing protein [Aliivibrio finisterrensis]